MTTIDDAFAECERLVREADKDRFLASLFAPAERRGVLMALYAFNVETARIAELVHQSQSETAAAYQAT